MPPFYAIIKDIIREIFEYRDNIISFILIILMMIAAIFASIYEKISTDRSIALASLSILFALLLSYYRLRQYLQHNPGSILRYLLPSFLCARVQAGGRTVRWLARGLFWSLGAVALYVAVLVYSNNFGTVIRGQLYRSAQLNSAAMSFNVRHYGIRAIINLRGSNPGEDWYDREVADAKALGVHHIDFRMSAKRELTREQAEELIALMTQAPKPLLIHCASGADRTGLAAALYMASIARAGRNKAEAQMSVFFGHLPLPFLPNHAMDRTWDRFILWLDESKSGQPPLLANSGGELPGGR